MTEEAKPLADLPQRIEELRQRTHKRTPEEIASYNWKNFTVPNLEAAQLPTRFWFHAKEWKPKQRQVFEQVKALLTGKGAIIALVGPRGLGKTTIAGQLILEKAEDESLPCPWHRRPPYRKLAALIATFKSLYADYGNVDTEQLLERLDSFCKDHPFVTIDELHDCEDLRIKNRLLTDVLDRRYSNRLDSLLIANQTPAEFQETTSDSVLSRMKEHGAIIHCTWESWR